MFEREGHDHLREITNPVECNVGVVATYEPGCLQFRKPGPARGRRQVDDLRQLSFAKLAVFLECAEDADIGRIKVELVHASGLSQQRFESPIQSRAIARKQHYALARRLGARATVLQRNLQKSVLRETDNNQQPLHHGQTLAYKFRGGGGYAANYSECRLNRIWTTTKRCDEDPETALAAQLRR